MGFFSNPWVIAVGAAVIAGIILYYIFGIGKSKPKQHLNDSKTDSQKSIQNTQSSVSIGNSNTNVIINQSFHQNDQKVLPSDPVETMNVDLTPAKIFHYIDSLPPLQRDTAALNYKGIKVFWKVRLGDYFSYRGTHNLLLIYDESLFPDIKCQVDLEKYPEFKIMKQGHKFTVEGNISSVDIGKVNLINCIFHF